MLISYYVAALAIVFGASVVLFSGLAMVIDSIFNTSLTNYFDEDFIYYGMIVTIVTTALFLVITLIELTIHLIS